MKQLLPPVLILLVMVSFSLWNSAAMAHSVENWCSQLDQAASLAGEEKWDGAAKALEESYRDWLRHQTYLRIVSAHDAVDSAEAMYCRAMAFAKTHELSEFQAETADLSAHLKLLAQMEDLHLHNIF